MTETGEETEEEHESRRRGEDVRGEEEVFKRKRYCYRVKPHPDRSCCETAARISQLCTFDLVMSKWRRREIDWQWGISLSLSFSPWSRQNPCITFLFHHSSTCVWVWHLHLQVYFESLSWNGSEALSILNCHVLGNVHWQLRQTLKPERKLIILPLQAAETSFGHNSDILSPYKVNRRNLSANSCLFIYSAHMERQQLHLESFILPPGGRESNIHTPFFSIFDFHQLQSEISGNLAAKCSTMFTSSSLTLWSGAELVANLLLLKTFT